MFDSISVGGRSAPSAVVVGRFKDKPAHASSKAYDPDGSVAEACQRPESSGEYLNLTHAFPKGSARSKTKAPPRVIVSDERELLLDSAGGIVKVLSPGGRL